MLSDIKQNQNAKQKKQHAELQETIGTVLDRNALNETTWC